MKIFYWNCRGIGNDNTRRCLSDFCRRFSPDIVGLAEPMILSSAVSQRFYNSINMDCLAVNNVIFPSLWVLVSRRIRVNVMTIGSQHVTIFFSVENCLHNVTVVYGATTVFDRRTLWDELRLVASSVSGPWYVLRGFNACLGAHEKTGRPPPDISCREFASTVDDCDLSAIDTLGVLYTWAGRCGSDLIQVRLDRAFCFATSLEIWSSISCISLPRHSSDHNPLFLRCTLHGTRPSLFRFRSMWATHKDFLNFVSDEWSKAPVYGSPMRVIMCKLKHLRSALRVWNFSVFGDLNRQIEDYSSKLEVIQLEIESFGFTESLHQQELEAHNMLDQVLIRQESLFREKSRIRWLQDGDRNTAFYHSVVQAKRAQASMSFLDIESEVTEDAIVIENHVINFYKDLFAVDAVPVDVSANVGNVIPTLVRPDDNIGLTSVPDWAEIKAVVHELDGSSAPGPDGFTGDFFKHCWEIVESDVCRAVQAFFLTSCIELGLNSSNMVLLPKVSTASAIGHYRPIVLSNFLFKVVTKILANRLALIVSRIVSPEQFGFIQGRNIQHCIAGAFECVNILSSRTQFGNFAMKIDIKKAFDTMRWNFLLTVLQLFGFCPTFCLWIRTILESSRISILLNGSPKGYFRCERGVRQGDPLSLLLFCLGEDYLSRLLASLVRQGDLVPLQCARRVSPSSHFLYADDILLFGRATKRNLKVIVDTFREYGEISGQQVSWEKSFIYFGSNISAGRRQSLASFCNVRMGTLPFSYLGVHLFKGKPRRIHLQGIADSILPKFDRWRAKHLFMAGRVCLVNSVISASFIHSFMVYKWPSSLIKFMEKRIRNFVWTGSVASKKLISVSWDR